jgi:hypothetical protein
MLLSRGWGLFLELLNLQKTFRFIIIRKTKKGQKIMASEKEILVVNVSVEITATSPQAIVENAKKLQDEI